MDPLKMSSLQELGMTILSIVRITMRYTSSYRKLRKPPHMQPPSNRTSAQRMGERHGRLLLLSMQVKTSGRPDISARRRYSIHVSGKAR
eukprot:7238419-Ditylum_brightwellii.AAC.1